MYRIFFLKKEKERGVLLNDVSGKNCWWKWKKPNVTQRF